MVHVLVAQGWGRQGTRSGNEPVAQARQKGMAWQKAQCGKVKKVLG